MALPSADAVDLPVRGCRRALRPSVSFVGSAKVLNGTSVRGLRFRTHSQSRRWSVTDTPCSASTAALQAKCRDGRSQAAGEISG